VRIVSNPAFSRDAHSPIHALALLADNLSHANHEFWPESLPVPTATKTVAAGLQGYQQLTDAYLLVLAHRRKSVFATFDRGVRTMASGDLGEALEIVPIR